MGHASNNRWCTLNLEKAFESQISQKNTDYQGLAEFKALTLRVNYDKKI
jgi:hypothetical protein